MESNAKRRRARIMEIIHENGEVKVGALSKLFNISEVTVRFDLEDLESKGLLSRVYGGAVSSSKLYHEMDLKQRYYANDAEKKAIAARAADMINNNDTIMMNAGTTLIYVLRAIKGKKNINLVTNSIPVATEAASYPGFNATLLGGFIDQKYQFTYGGDALAQLSRYHADKLVLSVDGINIESGFTLFYPHETDISKMMIVQSSVTVVAADSSKIGRIAFANIASVESADYIITNEKASREYIKAIRESGIDVITV